MDKRKRGNRLLTLIIIFFCVAIVFAMVWGIVTAVVKLMDYGEQTTIRREEEQMTEPEQTEQDEQSEEANPMDALPKNTYDPNCFYSENGIRHYESKNMIGVPGVDVSSHQGQIDWQAVKAAGIEFAMIRVGYRGYVTGELALDEYFLRNIEGALEAGIEVGAYFFSQALTEEEAVEEAEFVINWLQGYEVTYPVVFDWEEVQAQARTDEMNMLMLTGCAKAFCDKIEEAGYRAGIYFNQVYGYQQFNLISLEDYLFWLAEYEEAPSFVYHFQMWQYCNDGTVPGISGPVDLNIRFQTKEE